MNKQCSVKAYAKINLSIDVLGKRADGYHEVRMVMQQIGLWDEVTVCLEEKRNGVPAIRLSIDRSDISDNRKDLSCKQIDLPCDQSNLAWRAAELMFDEYRRQNQNTDIPYSVSINIQKNIPIAAGLAGGSADGAAVLHALNRLLTLGLSFAELSALGVKLGADVPFCLMGQAAADPSLGFDPAAVSVCAEARGIGEKLAPLPPLDSWVLLSKPAVSVSTKEVYGALRLDEIERHPDTEELIQNLAAGRLDAMYKNMYNVLEKPSELLYPVTVYTKNMLETGDEAIRVMMSGSGPTIFALAGDKEKLVPLYEKMRRVNPETYLIHTILLP